MCVCLHVCIYLCVCVCVLCTQKLDAGNKASQLLLHEKEKEQCMADNRGLRDEVLSLRSKLSDAEELGLRLVGARAPCAGLPMLCCAVV
jgi:hypothetical protein